MVGWKHYAIAVVVIALIGYINVRGIQMVGRVATILEISILLPIVALCVIAATKWHHNPFSPLVPPHVPPFQVFGAGLALGLWLYSGYEQVSSVAEEVENPQRSYPIALAVVIPLSIATYFLPTMFSLAALGDWQKWHTGYFSDAAALIGGPWLGFVMTIAAMVTNVSLLNTTVLTSSRMPSTMAEDGYLPATFSARHTHYGTPWIAIIVSSIIYALLAQKTIVQTADDLCVAAHWGNGADGAFLVAVAEGTAGFAAAVPYPLGPHWAALRHHCAAGDERGGAGGQRPVRAEVGTDAGAAGAGDVFCVSERQDGGVKPPLRTDRFSPVEAQHAAPLQNQSGEEIEDAVPRAGEGERPGVAAAQTNWSGGKQDAVEGNVVRIAANEASELRAEPSGGGDAVAGEARGKIHAVELSGVRHYIKREIEGSAPDKFYCGVAQLRVNIDHAAAENFGALAHGVFGFRKEGGAASEEHAIVRRETVVVKKIFRVVDHAIARAKFAGQIRRKNFRGNDVGADGDDFFCSAGVASVVYAPLARITSRAVSAPREVCTQNFRRPLFISCLMDVTGV